MKKIFIKILYYTVLIIFIGGILFYLLSLKEKPNEVIYGMSFNKMYADELGLPWREVFTAILDDLGVRNFRLSAHWNMLEPKDGEYNFSELDYQITEAGKRDSKIILAVGRRLPRWPECHEPGWARELSWEDRKEKILLYITEVVNRYKGNSAIEFWQVENEPFLTLFASEHCGDTLDKNFLEEEIALVKKLDPSRKIIVTDSGNLGLWFPAWRRGDAFGTSIYMYLWSYDFGKSRSMYTPMMFRAKENLVKIFFGNKPSFLIELSLEPWLLVPVPNVPIETQLERMDINKFEEIISYAKDLRFERQYLWGAEWWYWMKKHDHPEFWERGKSIFK